MMLQALLAAVPGSTECDRAALAVHCTMLEHGFCCLEPGSTAPKIVASEGGGAMLQVIPSGWKGVDVYSFSYKHPLREADETFTVSALPLGDCLATHAASSLQASALLTVTLDVPHTPDEQNRIRIDREWQEKAASGIALKLLDRHHSTARTSKVLTQVESAGERAASTGTKRPAPEGEEENGDRRTTPVAVPSRGFWPDRGGEDPFRDRPLFIPDGELIGPRHPAWRQFIPGRGTGGGGMLPRFDPIGPNLGGRYGEPDPDHWQPPGFGVDGFVGGRRGPDSNFII